MPILRNPAGVLVCVPEANARDFLRESPMQRDFDGKILKPGYSIATPAEVQEYHKQVKAAADAIAAQEAVDLEKRERNAFAVAKGLLQHMKGGKEK